MNPSFDFIDTVLRYLNDEINQNYVETQYEDIDPQILQDAQHIVNEYLDTGDVDKAVEEIKDYFSQLNQGKEGIPEYLGEFYHSNPNSDLPILLLYKLGLLPAYIANKSILPNEWKALLDAGLNLCELVDEHTYLYHLIMDPNIWNAVNLPFTADDILENIYIHPDCYPFRDRRDINLEYNRRLGEYRKLYQRLQNWQQEYEGNFTNIKFPVGDRRRLEELIELTPHQLERMDRILGIVSQILNQYPKEYPGKTIGRQISSVVASMGPRGRFPGGPEYRQGIELGRQEFRQLGGKTIQAELENLAQQNPEDIPWEQLLSIAGRLGILPAENPEELRNLIIEASPSPLSRYEDWEELLETGNELNLFNLPTERSQFLQYLQDYMTQL